MACSFNCFCAPFFGMCVYPMNAYNFFNFSFNSIENKRNFYKTLYVYQRKLIFFIC